MARATQVIREAEEAARQEEIPGSVARLSWRGGRRRVAADEAAAQELIGEALAELGASSGAGAGRGPGCGGSRPGAQRSWRTL